MNGDKKDPDQNEGRTASRDYTVPEDVQFGYFHLNEAASPREFADPGSQALSNDRNVEFNIAGRVVTQAQWVEMSDDERMALRVESLRETLTGTTPAVRRFSFD